jgi:cell division protease FtsH
MLTENAEQLEMLAKALLEYETLSGDEIKKVIAGEAIDRGGSKGPAIPAAGSSIPKAKRPKTGTIGGPAAAGA